MGCNYPKVLEKEEKIIEREKAKRRGFQSSRQTFCEISRWGLHKELSISKYNVPPCN